MLYWWGNEQGTVGHVDGRGENYAATQETFRGLRPVVQVRDAYCCSRRFSVVRCETSPVQIKGLVLALPKSAFTINVQTIKPF